jgi:hypothetical protein
MPSEHHLPNVRGQNFAAYPLVEKVDDLNLLAVELVGGESAAAGRITGPDIVDDNRMVAVNKARLKTEWDAAILLVMNKE